MKFLFLFLWSVLAGLAIAEWYWDWGTMSYQSNITPERKRKGSDPFAADADYVHKPEKDKRTKWWQSKPHKYKQSAFHRTSLQHKETTRRFGQRIMDPELAKSRLKEDHELLDSRKHLENEERRLSIEKAQAQEEQKRHPQGPKQVAGNAVEGTRKGLAKTVGVAVKAKAEIEQVGAKRRKLNPVSRPLKL